MRAYSILAIILVVGIALLGGIGFGIYSFINREPAEEQQEVVVEEEPIVVEEPEPVISENEVVQEEVEVEDEEPEILLPTEVSDEMKAEILDEYIARYVAGMTLEQKVHLKTSL